MALCGRNAEDQKGDMLVSLGYESRYLKVANCNSRIYFLILLEVGTSHFKMLASEPFSLASRMLSFFSGHTCINISALSLCLKEHSYMTLLPHK